MASDSSLAALIEIGHEINSMKLYAVSVTALWAYDYFLTLADEVRYAWKPERLLIFVIFLVTRYFPPVYQTWILVTMHYPGYTTEVCQKTAFLQIAYTMCITAAAQIVLIQRTYAITGKNKWLAGILYAIFTLQLGIAIYATIWAARSPVSQFPQVPLDTYRLCITNASKSLTVLQLSISLSFDAAVLILVVIQRRLIISRYQGMGGPGILSRISRDTEIYFGVIATSHFVVVIMLVVARVAIPIVGNAVLIPMMISRMIMSLREVASSRQTHVGIDIPGGSPTLLQDSHTPHRVENIRLSAIKQ